MPVVKKYAQAKYWMLTIRNLYIYLYLSSFLAHQHFTPYLPDGIDYLEGQLEQGEGTNYLHWQLVAACTRKCRLKLLVQIFGSFGHYEPTRSSAAHDYVSKEETRVDGTNFRLGRLPVNRNSSTDWDSIREAARSGNLSEVPADVYVRCYAALKNIAKDHLVPQAFERRIKCFWGRTGTGKSRLAWEEAGLTAYPKDPMSKFWDGYQQHNSVVIDEFRGDISISHILRWFDRYPVIIEAKHGATTLCATQIWVTSNINPIYWYPNAGQETVDALIRRLEITHFE